MIFKLAIVVIVVLLIVSPILMRWAKVKTFFDEVSFEMTKVSWPSQEEVINCTLLVAVSTFILTLMVGVVDKIFSMIVKIIY